MSLLTGLGVCLQSNSSQVSDRELELLYSRLLQATYLDVMVGWNYTLTFTVILHNYSSCRIVIHVITTEFRFHFNRVPSH